jgi:glutathione synthase/RimK-type ligase-like ATP-grasp enzyme
MANSLEAQLEDIQRRIEAEPNSVDLLFAKAQMLARLGRDDEAKAAFVALLQRDPTHFGALTDLAGLALATGYRSAAITAYRQAVDCHPDNPFGLVNLGNILLEDGDLTAARRLYEKALAIDGSLTYAHQGLANVLEKQGDDEGAARHREQGFAGHSVVVRPYRGTGNPPRVLLIVSAKGGNIPTNVILDDRIFAVTAVYAEYFDASDTLPGHDVVFNAVGDADLCGDVLDAVSRIAARSSTPVINPPYLIRDTGREANAARLSSLNDVIAPRTALLSRASLVAADAAAHLARHGFQFPLLLRSPGFHTGQNFARVESAEDLATAVRELPGEALLAIEYLDARGPDGMARKYRVMFIDGKFYPLHLALSHDWKVHYFTSAMADDAAFRQEEEMFLTNTAGALGPRVLHALALLREALALDYGGVDFGVAPDGRLLLFEANATMAIVPPVPDPVWDYRRKPIADAVDAARAMLFKRAGQSETAHESRT